MVRKYSEKCIIDIYQYMEFCGLVCERKGNVRLSHKAAERKLYKRRKKYPLKVSVPINESFQNIKSEDILSGKILLVRDDYDKIIPYRRPYIAVENQELTDLEKSLIREKLIEEELSKEPSESLKLGEIKYQEKKMKRKSLSL